MAVYTYKKILESPWIAQSEHLFVSVRLDGGPADVGLLEIDLFHQDHVVVSADYHYPEGMRLTQPDLVGNCLLRVPVSEDTKIYDEHEYSMICMAADADGRLLSYARG